MEFSSGASSNSSGSGSGLQISGSEEDLQLMDPRKIKRMISNRESARRSRVRKRNHLDGLMAHAAELRKENNQILSGLNVTIQHYLSVEAENSILRVQAAELSHRLHSLNEIASLGNCNFIPADEPAYYMAESVGFTNYFCVNQSQGILAAALDDAGGFKFQY